MSLLFLLLLTWFNFLNLLDLSALSDSSHKSFFASCSFLSVPFDGIFFLAEVFSCMVTTCLLGSFCLCCSRFWGHFQKSLPGRAQEHSVFSSAAAIVLVSHSSLSSICVHFPIRGKRRLPSLSCMCGFPSPMDALSAFVLNNPLQPQMHWFMPMFSILFLQFPSF